MEANSFEPLMFQPYGFIIAVGMMAAVMAVVRAAKTNDVDVDEIWSAFYWVIIGGIIGSRSYHVISEWEYYSQFPEKILAVWSGGLAIYGGIAGGTFGLLAYCLKSTHNFNYSYNAWWSRSFSKTLKLGDLAVIGVPIGQAIGRLGNWTNQELYGPPTSLPWAIAIDPVNRLKGYEIYSHFHPLFAYEALWNSCLFLLLLLLFKSKLWEVGSGKFILTYLGGYGLGRFFLDEFRLNVTLINMFTLSQWISLGIITISLTSMYFMTRNSQ